MEEVTIERLIQQTKDYLPDLNEARLLKAYSFASTAHEGQVRFSGKPYITHPLETAFLLLPLHPDEDTLIAALLHDVLRETSYGVRDIESPFGRSVASLVSAVDKLSLVKMQPGTSQVDVWRKMVMAMAKDLRAIFIKLAERLHNVRTLQYVDPSKQARIADETLRVYAPIASRLGLYALKSELEDLSFRVLYPRESAELEEQLSAYGALHEHSMKEAQAALEHLLAEEGIAATVSGRIKHLYSIYRKMKKNDVNSVDAIYDLFAMRVILRDQFREGVPFMGHCYTVLGLLHNRWDPIAGRFKDYIAVPKLNGYQSLHTTFLNMLESLPDQPVEVQIRTESMHRESDLGVAAHWLYETSNRSSTTFSKASVEPLIMGRRLMARLHALLGLFPHERLVFQSFFQRGSFQRDRWTPEFTKFLRAQSFTTAEVEGLIHYLSLPLPTDRRSKMIQDQLDWLCGVQSLPTVAPEANEDTSPAEVTLFEDRIFVLTPSGEVKDLPSGATPVDFAYSVHSDLGHRCHQAKVNGVLVPLNHALKNGDVVEILTRKLPQPNRYWLSFTKTIGAKNRIKAWFRSLDREKSIRLGRDLLNRELRRLNKPLLGPQYQLLQSYSGKPLEFHDREHVVELVGNGTMSVTQVLRMLFPEMMLLGVAPRALNSDGDAAATSTVLPSSPVATPETPEILVTGQSDLPILLAACCKPKPLDSIVGHITRNKIFRIHRVGCYQLDSVREGRLLPAHWKQAAVASPRVHLRLTCEDRVGLLRDVLAVVADQGQDVVDLSLVSKSKGEVTRDLILHPSRPDQDCDGLMRLLKQVGGVKSVKPL